MGTFRFRVLFVDDEPAVRSTGAAVLESAGYEVLTAEDGLDGLNSLDQALPDLIISDLRMPKMSGFEFLAVIRNRFPQIPTIALSGEYVTDNIPDGLLADTFFQKGNYSIPEFLGTVRQMILKAPERPVQGKRNFSPIWIALNGSGQVIVTCPKCLRSFDVEGQDMTEGTHIVTCTSCSNEFEFRMDHLSIANIGPAHVSAPPAKVRKVQSAHR
jgi:CheY-like chemotaxis protein